MNTYVLEVEVPKAIVEKHRVVVEAPSKGQAMLYAQGEISEDTLVKELSNDILGPPFKTIQVRRVLDPSRDMERIE